MECFHHKTCLHRLGHNDEFIRFWCASEVGVIRKHTYYCNTLDSIIHGTIICPIWCCKRVEWLEIERPLQLPRQTASKESSENKGQDEIPTGVHFENTRCPNRFQEGRKKKEGWWREVLLSSSLLQPGGTTAAALLSRHDVALALKKSLDTNTDTRRSSPLPLPKQHIIPLFYHCQRVI